MDGNECFASVSFGAFNSGDVDCDLSCVRVINSSCFAGKASAEYFYFVSGFCWNGSSFILLAKGFG